MKELDEYLSYPEDYELEKIGVKNTDITYRTYYKILKILDSYDKDPIKKIIVTIINSVQLSEIPSTVEEQKEFFTQKIHEEIEKQNKQSSDLVSDNSVNLVHEINEKTRSIFEFDDFERIELYDIATRAGWKNHEFYSIEELYSLVNILNEYFKLIRIIGHDHDFNGFDIPMITKYSIIELQAITNSLSEQILKIRNKRSKFKKRKEKMIEFFQEDKAKLGHSDIKLNHLRNKNKSQFVEYSKISNSELIALDNIIPKIREYGNNEKIKDLEHAQLLLLNCEIKSRGYEEKTNIQNAREFLRCINAKKLLKNKYPNEDFTSKNCDDVMKLYENDFIPKDFPILEYDENKARQWDIEVKERLERMKINLHKRSKL